jgi:Leucine-rich repeat (LRR) protein
LANQSRLALSVPMRCFLSTLGIFVVLNLPYRFAEYAPSTLGELQETRPSLHSLSSREREAIFGGWPLRYLAVVAPGNVAAHQQPQLSVSSTCLSTISTASLLGNSLLAAACGLVLASMAAFSARWAATIAVAGVAGLLGFTGYQGATDLASAKRLARYGMVERSAIVPACLTRFVPSYALPVFSKVRGVMLYRVDAQSVAAALDVPTVDMIGFWKRFPAPDQLEPLITNPRLRQLSIIDADLDESVIDFITLQSDLRCLELVGCRGLTERLAEIQGLNRLHTFDGTRSDFPISSLSGGSWIEQLQHLRLSPPASGASVLEVRNARHLQSLTIHGRNSDLNPDVLTLQFDDVPQLRAICLPHAQKLDLSIFNAPRLQHVRIEDSEGPLAGSFPADGPNGIWLQRLQLSSTPSLRKFVCYGLDVSSIDIKNAPNLTELTINSDYYLANKLHSGSATQADLAALIASLGRCEGPPIVNLSTLPLQGLDLSPLAKNLRIRELILAGTGINGEQLKPLLTLPRLLAVDVRGCSISNAEVAEAVALLPRLKAFHVDAANLKDIEVVDRDELTAFLTGLSPQASRVNISGSPYLESELLLGNCVRDFLIRDAVSLRGISIDGPVPRDATIHGVRDLQFCALGGRNVDDRLCESIWRCLKLNHLTLAHTKVTRQALGNIRHLESLHTLILPGNDIDDSVVAAWDDLKHLQEVDLSHTRTSTRTAEFLLSRPNLQRLSIGYTDIDKADLRELTEVAQLTELDVAGVGLEEQTLRAITSGGILDRLDLSDCELSPQIVQLLASGSASTLFFLGLRNCGLDEADIRTIVAAHPNLAVDVVGNAVDEVFCKELADAGRLVCRTDRVGFLRSILRADQHHSAVLAGSKETATGRINVHQFVGADMITASR